MVRVRAHRRWCNLVTMPYNLDLILVVASGGYALHKNMHRIRLAICGLDVLSLFGRKWHRGGNMWGETVFADVFWNSETKKTIFVRRIWSRYVVQRAGGVRSRHRYSRRRSKQGSTFSSKRKAQGLAKRLCSFLTEHL